MSSRFLKTTVVLALCLAAAGCSKKAATSAFEDGVVGPDLDKTGPFASAQQVVLAQPPFSGPDAAETNAHLMRITIARQPDEDVATLEHVISDTKTYLAGVTYKPFLPIIAETNVEQKDYWIVGLNASRTPDRSLYTVLRFPHGLKIEPGLSSDAFEYLTLDCADLDMARRDSFTATGADGKPAGQPIALKPAPRAEAGTCEFNSLAEVLAVTPAVFGNYDRVKHAPDAPQPVWNTLHVEVR